MRTHPNLLNKITNKIANFFTKSDVSLVESYDTEPTNIENVEDYYKLITQVSAIFKSITEISQTIISQEWKIKNENNEKDVEVLPIELEKLLAHPTNDLSFNEYLSLIITDLLIAGNIFGVLEKSSIDNRLVINRLDPQFMEYFNGQWQYNHPTRGLRTIDNDLLIHSKLYPDPYNPMWGKGVIASNIALFNHINSVLEFREKFYQNGCFPGGVFSVENAGGITGLDQIKEKIDKDYKGTKNAGEPMVLSGKVTYTQTQLDPTQLKVADELVLLYKEVMICFGLPKYLMEIGVRDTGQKFNNHAKQKEHYIKNTILPIAKRVEDYFSEVVKKYNDVWKFKFNIISEIYSEETLQKLLDAGELTPNEHRKFLNIEEVEDDNLDKYYANANKKLLSDIAEGSEGESSPTSEPEKPQPEKPTDDKPEPEKEPEANNDKQKKKSISNGTGREKTWRDNDYLSEPLENVWTVNELKIDRNKKRIAQDFININKKTRTKKTKESKLKYQLYLIDLYSNVIANLSANADELNRLSGVTKQEEPPEETEKFLNKIYSSTDDLNNFYSVTIPIYQSVGESTYSNSGNILTVELPFSVNDPGVASKINVMRQTGPLVTETTRGKIAQELTKGIEAGQTHTQIAKNMWRRFVDEDNNLLDEFSKIYRKNVKPQDFDQVMSKGGKLQNRAVLIARTEVAQANKLFASESMKKSNLIKTITIIDCDPCPICAPHQNVPVTFAEADTISNLHPNCTGTIVPSGFQEI